MIAGLPTNSQRLTIRGIQRDEWIGSYALRTNPELRTFGLDRPIQSIDDDIRFWDREVGPGRFPMSALLPVSNPDGGLLGSICAFDHDPEDGSCETGITISSPQHRNRGLATVVYRALLPHLQEHWRLDQIKILTHPDNAKSIALSSRLGFKHQGQVPDSPQFSWTKMILCLDEKR